jgi:hypothetical protein
MVKDVIFQELKPAIDVWPLHDDTSLAEKHDVPLQASIPKRNRKINV